MGERNEGAPNWSPDGNSIMFGNLPNDLYGGLNDSSPAGQMAIHLVDLNTQTVTSLPGSEGLWSPSWSPDGRYVAAKPADEQKVLLFDFHTRKWAELAQLPPGSFSWSRDARYLYFDTIEKDKPSFYRIRISDRRLELVTSLKDIKRSPHGSVGLWTGLAPGNIPLTVRDISSQNIYAIDWDLP